MVTVNGLMQTLKTACQLFQSSGIRYCLAGGLAVAMVARPRATEDIDFIILAEESEKGRIEDIFKGRFDVVQSNAVMRFRNASIWRLVIRSALDRENLTILDLVFADRPVYRAAIENALTVVVNGFEIAVASPEDLIKMKELSGRPIDLMDIEMIKEECFGQCGSRTTKNP